MKKLMAFVLSFGLVLLGTAPVMAASQTLSSPIPVASLSTATNTGFDIPDPDQAHPLSDEELQEVDGEIAPILVTAGEILLGVAIGVAANYIYDHYIKPKPEPKKCKCECSCEATCQ